MGKKSFFLMGLVLLSILIFSVCNDSQESDSQGLTDLPLMDRAGVTTFNRSGGVNDWADDGDDGSVTKYVRKASVNNSNYSVIVDWTNNPTLGFVYGPGWNGGPDEVNYQITDFINPEGGCNGIYGWLHTKSGGDGYVEFYIMETVGSKEGPHNNDNDGLVSGNTLAKPDYLGSYVVDGCTYDFYQHKRKNKPSPEGNKDFWQWIAVNRRVNPEHSSRNENLERQFPRLSGKISFKDHRTAWETFGKKIDTIDWTTFNIEAFLSPPQNSNDPTNSGTKRNPDGKGTTLSYTNGYVAAKFTANPVGPTITNINLIGPPDSVSGIYMYMNGSNLSQSTTVSPNASSAIFRMYVTCMTTITRSGYTRYAKVVAFMNGSGKFLTVNASNKVVESSITDWKKLTDAEKFVYEDNYGYCNFMSLKNYNNLDVNGKCLSGNNYGNFTVRYNSFGPLNSPPPPYCYLNNDWSRKLMTVANNSSYASILSQGLNTGWESQRWKLEEINGGAPTGGATVRIKSKWSGKYLTVTNTSDYADVKAQYLNTSWASQEWVIEGDLSQARFKNVWSGKYLTVTSQSECASIKCQPLHYDWESQLWRLQY